MENIYGITGLHVYRQRDLEYDDFVSTLKTEYNNFLLMTKVSPALSDDDTILNVSEKLFAVTSSKKIVYRGHRSFQKKS
jgi:hypothetical protein